MRCWYCWACAAVLLVSPASLLAWQDDDDEFQPGLLLQTESAGETRSQIVTDPIVAPRKTAEPARFRWTGNLLVRGEGPHQFHAYLQGKLTARLGEQTILEATLAEPGWVSGEFVELTFGEFPLQVSFDTSRAGDQLKLYWSSPTFPLEPLPYHALFHNEDAGPLKQIAAGRDFADAWRCASCHTSQATPQPLPGPSLANLATETDIGWLRERLTRKEPAEHSRMPAFGFSNDDADAVLAYLVKHGQSQPLKPVEIKRSEKDLAAGAQLLKSVGCLACHEWQTLGKNPIWGGGPLNDAAGHRTAAWLLAKITDPHAVNPASRMPAFALSDTERKQIVAVLQGQENRPKIQSAEKSLTVSDELVARGGRLIAKARCAACHDLPGPAVPWSTVKELTAESITSPKSCVGTAAAPSDQHQPRFSSTAAEAIAAYWATRTKPDLTPPVALTGERLLATKGCLSCHDRNGSRGLSAITKDIVRTEPTWEGQSPTLTPPSLGAVGDRLPDEVLVRGVRGELKRRMDWLKVRMPRFRHTDEEAQALADHLRDWDRIPNEPPASPVYPVTGKEAAPEVLLAGRELTGGKGFSCVACHQLKDYVPPKVALGTRGSDLYRLGDRMRAEYFFRWTRSPLRVLPGIEMPSYQRPHPTILGGDMNSQLAAIWDALHDPQFTAPTNPAVVEQLWGPHPDGTPRILRDVFTVTNAEGKLESVPRTLAVGFANRHSILFDLGYGGVRTWTIGDFARQRTQGKSWFWDLAGVPVATDFAAVPDLYLFDDRTQSVIAPETGWQAQVRFLQSTVERDLSVRFRYELSWSREKEPASRTLLVYERWQAVPYGWRRGVDIEEAPVGHSVWLRRPVPGRKFGSPQIALETENWGRPQASAPEAVNVSAASRATQPAWLKYSTQVELPAESPPADVPIVQLQREAVTCVPGFTGERLALPRSIMPTAMAWDTRGELYFTSLKGHVFKATEGTNGSPDGIVTVAEGLSAPFGIIPAGDRWLVAHKPEVLAMSDRDADGLWDRSEVVASGWGFTDDYHDWTCGIVGDAQGHFYVGLGSDYSHKNRPEAERRWRGHILRFDLHGKVEPVATGLRYPTGLAMLPGERLVVSDQQGVQNCFNELDVIVPGQRYGVPAQLDPRDDGPTTPAAVQIPHPWTRSVNGVAVWPNNGHPFAGQVIAAEYNGRFLIRAALEEVDGVMQGAVFQLHRPGETNGPQEFLGPMCVGFSPSGALYVGSIHDSGWLGGLNTGDLVKLTPNDQLPNGLQRIRATAAGFDLDFLQPVDRDAASRPSAYQVSGYTREWQGEYATPDSGRHAATVTEVVVSADGRTVSLSLDGLKTGYVYDIAVTGLEGPEKAPLWPALGHYTLHRRPK